MEKFFVFFGEKHSDKVFHVCLKFAWKVQKRWFANGKLHVCLQLNSKCLADFIIKMLVFGANVVVENKVDSIHGKLHGNFNDDKKWQMWSWNLENFSSFHVIFIRYANINIENYPSKCSFLKFLFDNVFNHIFVQQNIKS